VPSLHGVRDWRIWFGMAKRLIQKEKEKRKSEVIKAKLAFVLT
jgi:hypothetical protein